MRSLPKAMVYGTRNSVSRRHSGDIRPQNTRSLRQGLSYPAAICGICASLLATVLAPLDLAAATPQVRTVTIVETRVEHNRRVFSTAWEWINSHYYDATFNGTDWGAVGEAYRAEAEAASDEEQLYAVLARMTASIGDTHTRIAGPREVREQGHTQRTLLGFVSRPAADTAERWTIVGVMPGSPAADAGVRPGWTLDACDNQPPAAVLGSGAPLETGRVVHCSFSDEENRKHLLALSAAVVDPRPIHEARMLEKGRVYIRFDEFDGETLAWLRATLREYADAPGLVLDLRFNSGGEISVLEEIVGELCSRPVVIGSLVSRAGEADTLKARRAEGAATVRAPIAILVSRDSMSCAEIFAQVMRSEARAVVVGTRTAGMVLGTVAIPLPGGGELQLSVWDFHTSAGERLEGRGVTPDVELSGDEAHVSAGLNAGIAAAVAALGAN